MSAAKEPGQSTTPVIVLTGFLGSGKTTLLNRLMQHPEMADSAVIVNEFGDIGLDHILVESAHENTVLLSSGCLCCTVRGDLVDTLSDLHGKRAAGEVPEFSRVVIETTGLADPAPVLRTLIGEAAVIERFRLAGVVTTLDAVHGMGQLDEHREPRDQVAVADVVVLTKTDIATPGKTAALRDRLRQIAPTARFLEVVKGDVKPSSLLSGVGIASDARSAVWSKTNRAEHHHAHDHTDLDVNRHDDRIAAISVVRDRPLAWRAVQTWLESIASLRGADLLRVKGIVNVEGIDAPVIVHGVQHVFDPPRRLERWPDDDCRTRIVLIARDFDGAGVNAALDAVIDG